MFPGTFSCMSEPAMADPEIQIFTVLYKFKSQRATPTSWLGYKKYVTVSIRLRSGLMLVDVKVVYVQ